MLSFQNSPHHLPASVSGGPMILPKGFVSPTRSQHPENFPGFDRKDWGGGRGGSFTPSTSKPEVTGNDSAFPAAGDKDGGHRSRSQSSDSISDSVSGENRKQPPPGHRKRRREEATDEEEVEQELEEMSSDDTSRKLEDKEEKDKEEGDDEEEEEDLDAEGQIQRQILTQKPLGLLAYHGLSARSTTSGTARFHRKYSDVDEGRCRRSRKNGRVSHRDAGSINRDPGSVNRDPGSVDRDDAEDDETCDLEPVEGSTDGVNRPEGTVLPNGRGQRSVSSPYLSPILGAFAGSDVMESGRACPPDYDSQISLMDQRFMPSPPLSASPGSGHCPSTPGHHWTFEEQFKQLYELSDDPNRKLFLDDLFSFMQKRGTPVNRIPIMAKQTLDLFELFQLVVSKGGLVEVINKKLWREITKGLNLPSSITSAAFTLRTQYMKYLYPYECEKLKLSTLNELQYAVDGNRREGRRSGFGQDFNPLPPIIPLNPAVVAHMHEGLSGIGPASRTPVSLSLKERDQLMLNPTINQLRTLAECDAQAVKAATQAMAEVTKRMEEATRAAAAAAAAAAVTPSNPPRLTISGPPGSSCPAPRLSGSLHHPPGSSPGLKGSEPVVKRPTLEEAMGFPSLLQRPPVSAVSTAHIKLTSQQNGQSNHLGNSIIGSMEINGILYQGVLFAQPMTTSNVAD